MRLMRVVFGVLALSALVVGLAAACGGDDEESEEPAAVTSPEAVEPTAEAPGGEEEEGVIREFTGGSAEATVKVGDQTLTFEGGECAIGDNDDWLAVNIGEVGGDSYFGLTAGKTPADESVRSAKGGGEFGSGEFLVAWIFEGSEGSVVGQDGRLDVASDLKSGEFEGRGLDGNELSGSFTCE